MYLLSSLVEILTNYNRIPAATASFFAGHLANKVGRVKGVAIGELVFAVGAAIEAGAVKSLGMLIVGVSACSLVNFSLLKSGNIYVQVEIT